MDRTNQSELDEIVRRMQRGENLERRRKRPGVLDEWFRRRNALMRRVAVPPSQPVSGVSGRALPAPEATQLSGRTAAGLADSRPQANTRLKPEVRTGVFVSLPDSNRAGVAGSGTAGKTGLRSDPVTQLGGSGTPPAGAESTPRSHSAPVPKPKKGRRA